MAAQLVAPVIEEGVGLGDHVAFFFKTNAERLAFAIPYMVRGIQNRERCVYIAHENTLTEILAEFMRAGIDIDASTASGALSVVTTHDSYLRHGIFEPEKMIADLDRDVRFALQLGYSGLRVTGEMSWALDLPYALSRLCEYEQELCRRWPTQLAGLCQYNESLFSTDVVERMVDYHCITVRNGNIIRRYAHGATLEA
jgi:hypothetical protein